VKIEDSDDPHLTSPLVRGRDWIFIPARVGLRPMRNFPKGKGEQKRENHNLLEARIYCISEENQFYLKFA
jgi:hypothetical protein